VLDGEEVFGDTVKKNREFNAFANVAEGDSFTLPTTYLPVGESPVEEFEVTSDVSMVVASASIETATAFVLEDPAGNRYGSGIGLPVLGSSVGTAAPGMPGTWKLYSRGIGSISGVSVDPLGVTNGVGIPGTNDVNIRLLVTSGYTGIDDAVGHPAKPFIEYVVANELMDAKESGFAPDAPLTRVELADTLALSANLRQTNDGNTVNYTDVSAENAAAVNSATATGAVLGDLDMNTQPVMQADGDFFGSNMQVSKEEMAYSMVQALGLEDAAQSFDSQKVIAIVLGEAVEVEDTDAIAPEYRGYVQQALAAGLMQVEVKVEQGPFDLQPTLKAFFNPQNGVSRGEAAFILTQYTEL
jgi:hypothetical protein